MVSFLDEMTNFGDSHKHLNLDLGKLKPLEEFVKRNFLINEDSKLFNPLIAIIYCLKIPLYFFMIFLLHFLRNQTNLIEEMKILKIQKVSSLLEIICILLKSDRNKLEETDFLPDEEKV